MQSMILLRHGQSEFNLAFTQTRRDPGIKDPKLTPLGHEQAQRAAEALAGAGIVRILASPYTRALQTAAPVAAALGVPVQIHPVVRERYAFTCDVGSPVSHLAVTFPEHDFSTLPEVWWPDAEEGAEGVLNRAALFRAEMSARQDWAHTLVVSHWGFILSMTGISAMNGQWLRCDPTTPALTEVSWRH